MSTAIRYLRLYLHTPTQGRRQIGYLSQYGDILRVSFDADYIADIDRPSLSLDYQGSNDGATRAILSAPRDVRLVRSDGKWFCGRCLGLIIRGITIGVGTTLYTQGKLSIKACPFRAA